MQNFNDIIAVSIAFNLAVLIFLVWVVYMFYARLRDIGDELRKFRTAYEMAEDSKLRPTQSPRDSSGPSDDPFKRRLP